MGVPGSVNNLLGAGGAPQYLVERSLRFNSSDSAYLSKGSWSTSTNRDKGTISWWVKRSSLAASSIRMFHAYDGGSNASFDISLNSDHTLGFNYGGGAEYINTTSAVFRDVSAWYHVVCAWDTTDATSSNRIKIYVNGVQQSLGTANYPPQNADALFPNTSTFIGAGYGPGAYFNGYLADVIFVDGQALDPTSFTETDPTTGQLIPKAYSGSFGTNGFWLKFSDNSAATATTLGKDYSGNSNNWTPNNLSVTAGAGNDSLTDTPTSYGTDTGAGGEVRGNYATLNPLAKTISSGVSSDAVVENGNLFFRSPGTYRETFPATMAIAGKTYFEGHVSVTSSSYWQIGLLAVDQYNQSLSNVDLKDYGANCFTWYASNGNVYVGSSLIRTTTAPGADAIVGLAFDPSTGDVYGYINGSVQNSGNPIATLSTSKTYIPAFLSARNDTDTWVNFGQRQWAYAAPAGFKALCTTNLPEPTIALPSTVMDVKLYTGNSSTQTISGLGFSPDFVWLKQRTNAENHGLFDTVRGAQKSLCSNNTNAENATDTNSLTAFTSDGFSLGNTSRFNDNTYAHVAWTWDAGSSTSTNNSGSISSQVRANPSAGFSIVTYTGNGTAGATVGHGLGVEPHFIICKSRSGSTGWLVYHKSLGNTNYLILNATDASAAAAGAWNNTTPTSSVFTIGTGSFVNTNGATQVSYCFAPVAGYSSISSWVGNGSSDGVFVWTGFRPRFLLWKNTTNVANWYIYDSVRDIDNVVNLNLEPNTSDSENVLTSMNVDFLSNGFKMRGTDGDINGSGSTYVYLAVAESPFQYARAR